MTRLLKTVTHAQTLLKLQKFPLTGKVLKDMFACEDRASFARDLITPIVEKRVSQRESIKLPSNEQMIDSLRDILEEIADEEGAAV